MVDDHGVVRRRILKPYPQGLVDPPAVTVFATRLGLRQTGSSSPQEALFASAYGALERSFSAVNKREARRKSLIRLRSSVQDESKLHS